MRMSFFPDKCWSFHRKGGTHFFFYDSNNMDRGAVMNRDKGVKRPNQTNLQKMENTPCGKRFLVLF